MNTSTKIAFIGGGNMAAGIVGGLINSNWQAGNLSVSDPLAERRQQLAERFGVHVYADNAECAARGAVVVLAVKPKWLQSAAASVGEVLQRQKPLVISIAAGIRCENVLQWAGGALALVRAMPNTPALVNVGMSGLYATEQVTEPQRNLAESILGAVGETAWVADESLIDAVTAVSGSGPAYFFKLMELMTDSAVRHGIDPATAHTLAVQTALGAAALAKHDPQTPAMLLRQVTSRGGTTEAALEKMQALGIDEAVEKGIDTAVQRAAQLADEFGAA